MEKHTLPLSLVAQPGRPVSLLLRSSWQTVNIGDIGHTPGVVALLERYLPEVAVTLWSFRPDPSVADMLKTRFPALKIVYGNLDSSGQADTDELATALAEADFLLHGSAPGIVALPDLESWSRNTGKPYGIYGVTIDPLSISVDDPGYPGEGASLGDQSKQVDALAMGHLNERLRAVLEGAEFVYCRDRLSLRYLRNQSVQCPIMDFAPDGAFGIDLRNDEKAEEFLRNNGLEAGRFIAVIPRLRYTPYHLVHGTEATGRDLARVAVSERHRERDLAKLREVVVQWVRQTGLKALLCPEMTYQVDVAKADIYDQLPEDVRDRVVWRPDYWLPDEACSTFARSLAVLSMDNHSPIFALALGVPTIFLRHSTDTIKGQMWLDLGMDKWFFEIDAVEAEAISKRLMEIHHDRRSALAYVDELMERVRSYQEASLMALGEILEPVVSQLAKR